MKKFLLTILIVGMCCMLGCAKNETTKINVGDPIMKIKSAYGSPHITFGMGAILVFKDGQNYTVTISDYTSIVGVATFDAEGKLLYSKDINLISAENMAQFDGKSFDEVEKQFGKEHIDIGSGGYIPAYITDSATIIIMSVDGDIVSMISSMDIITGMYTTKGL